LKECLSGPQLRAVLAHELCHIRRHDNVTAAVHMIVEAVFWFHPLAWWIGAQLLKERERACDEYVLQIIGEPRTYAEAILVVCKRYVESPLACAPGVTASNIRDRIEDIMNNRIGVRLSNPRRAAIAVGIALAVGVPFVVGILTTPLQAKSVKRSTDPTALTRAKETVLKYSLFRIRQAIDKYLTEKKQYPTSLPQLVSEAYLSQIPTDPFTDRFDSWKTLLKRPADYPDAPVGIQDVSSGSSATALDGTKYSTW
jgi:BlaR1 peptidase M56